MREPSKDKLRIIHMIEACKRLNDYFPDNVIPDFDGVSMEYFGIVKNLEIIGEAAYKLSHEFTDSHPSTDWKSIIGMRHLMVHGYYTINPKIVKEILETEIKPLHNQLICYLAEM